MENESIYKYYPWVREALDAGDTITALTRALDNARNQIYYMEGMLPDGVQNLMSTRHTMAMIEQLLIDIAKPVPAVVDSPKNDMQDIYDRLLLLEETVAPLRHIKTTVEDIESGLDDRPTYSDVERMIREEISYRDYASQEYVDERVEEAIRDHESDEHGDITPLPVDRLDTLEERFNRLVARVADV